jgi:hypothetical protein
MDVKRGLGAFAFLLAALSASSSFADESEESVNNAFTVCQMLDSTGSLTEPCDVSGWNSSVIISVDASPGEARKLCPSIKKMLQNNNMKFGPGWTMKVTSPYSGDKAIATCPL